MDNQTGIFAPVFLAALLAAPAPVFGKDSYDYDKLDKATTSATSKGYAWEPMAYSNKSNQVADLAVSVPFVGADLPVEMRKICVECEITPYRQFWIPIGTRCRSVLPAATDFKSSISFPYKMDLDKTYKVSFAVDTKADADLLKNNPKLNQRANKHGSKNITGSLIAYDMTLRHAVEDQQLFYQCDITTTPTEKSVKSKGRIKEWTSRIKGTFQ